MTWDVLREEIVRRAVPAADPAAGWWTLAALAVAALLVVVPGAWRLVRPAVTIVHELGHALTGILAGRRFTGFVVNGDMSGHAVTVGPPRGLGRIVSTWSGYPAPGIVGALLVQIAFSGWSRPIMSAALVVLVLSLAFVRSAHTLLVIVASIAAVGAVWWLAGPTLLAASVLAIGTVLLIGAWRHLATVVSRGRGTDDPQQLARLTGVSAGVWNLLTALVLAGCTWWAWRALAPHVL